MIPRSRFVSILSVFLVSSVSLAAEHSTTLTDTAENIQIDNWSHMIVHDGESCSIRKSTLHGGRQEGVDVIDVNNGRLQFRVVPTRGMGILWVQCGDVRLGWDSPIQEIVHPMHVDLDARGGLGWLHGFNEWMVRCGLEWAGSPGTDTMINNQGDSVSMELSLHGRIANIPATKVVVSIDKGPQPRIRIRGLVEEITFHGPKLEIWTEISTELGSSEFQISDTVTNRSASPQEMQIIYHANYGTPILEKGAKLVAPIDEVSPFNDRAVPNVRDHATYDEPTPGYVETVYCIHPKADPRGDVTILLHNATGDQGVSMKWPINQLPYLTQWKNTIAQQDGYVTGLEPATGFPLNRQAEREGGRVPVLEGGQSRTFTLDFNVLTEEQQVRTVVETISRIQGADMPKFHNNPLITSEAATE